MKTSPTIFKSYDVRGIYPKELNGEIAYRVAQAFVRLSKAKKIAIGRDSRLSSPQLYRAVVKGFLDLGVDVDDIGLAPVTATYFTVGKFKYPAGIHITASHNPKEYNGLKMLTYNKKIGGITYVRGKDLPPYLKEKKEAVKTKGRLKKIEIKDDYVKHILSFVDSKKIKPLKVVVDAGNGTAGLIIPALFKKLRAKLIPLYFKPDGSFPNHPSNPLLKGVTDDLRKKVLATKADLGVIFDGDADRMYLVDEKGKFIRGDTILILIAQTLLKKFKGAKIGYNLICSKAVPTAIKKMGGVALRGKVGYVNLAELLATKGGIASGEISGHFSFRNNFFADDGFIAMMICLQTLSETGQKLSALVSQFMPFTIFPEVNMEIENVEKTLKRIKKVYANGKQDFLDGLTVQFKDWWFNLRASNTQPLLRLTIEAESEKLALQKKKELIKEIGGKISYE